MRTKDMSRGCQPLIGYDIFGQTARGNFRLESVAAFHRIDYGQGASSKKFVCLRDPFVETSLGLFLRKDHHTVRLKSH